jgi:cell division protein FtsZ
LAGEESRKEIAGLVSGTDLCFVTSGMGGGTGSGAAPVVAEVAKEEGCLTVGIVTKPFAFEGKRRMRQAIAAIERLREHVDTVIVVSNDRLLEIIPDDTPMERAFAVADDILRQGVVGISDIIVKPGLINVDFADVRAIMNNAGTALMGIGIGSGKTAATDAAAAAISSPLLDSTIDNAKGVVFNISGGPRLSLNEVNQAAKLIYSTVEADANVIFGALVDETLGDQISITVLATGFTEKERVPEYKFGAGAAASRGGRYASTAYSATLPGLGKKEERDAVTMDMQREEEDEDEDDESEDYGVNSESPDYCETEKQDKEKSGGGSGRGGIPAFLRNLKRR